MLGKVSHPQGEIAILLCQEGLAKTYMPKQDEEFDQDFYKQLKDA